MGAYNVYAATNRAGEFLYIGSGVSDRHRHVTSGISHVYELNQLHFSCAPVDVNIIKEFDTRTEALAYEKELIAEKSPKFNKVYNGKVSRIPVYWRIQPLITSFILENIDGFEKIGKCRSILRELFTYVKPQAFCEPSTIINASKANTDEQRCYRKFKWHMTAKASLVPGSIGAALRLVIQSDSRSTYRFTDEFKEFLKKSIEK